MYNTLISVYIPTYNRPSYLQFCLQNIISQAKKHKIKIFISDNCSNDETKFIVDGFLTDYNGIIYNKQTNLITLDENQLFFTNIVDTKFCLMLADDDALEKFALDNLIEVLQKNNDIDMILLNAFHYTENMSKRKYLNSNIKNNIVISDPKELLKNHFFQMHYSTLVLNMELCTNLNKANYYNTYHAYCGIAFDYLSIKFKKIGKTKILYIAEPFIMLRDGIKTYSSETLDVYFTKFPSFFTKLPSIYKKLAETKIRSLSSNNTNISFLARLKLNQILSIRNYKNTFLYLTIFQKIKVFVICLIPIWIIKITTKVLRFLIIIKNSFK